MKFELEDLLPQDEESVAMITAVNDGDASIESLCKELNDTAELMDAYQDVLKKIDDKSVDLKAFKTIREAAVEGFISTDPRETMEVAIEGLSQKFVSICKTLWQKIKQFFQDLHRIIFKKIQHTNYLGETKEIQKTKYFSDTEMQKLASKMAEERIPDTWAIEGIQKMRQTLDSIGDLAILFGELANEATNEHIDPDSIWEALGRALGRLQKDRTFGDHRWVSFDTHLGQITFDVKTRERPKLGKISTSEVARYLTALDKACTEIRHQTKNEDALWGKSSFLKNCEKLLNTTIPNNIKKVEESNWSDEDKSRAIKILNRLTSNTQSLSAAYGKMEAHSTQMTFGTHTIIARRIREIVDERIIPDKQ